LTTNSLEVEAPQVPAEAPAKELDRASLSEKGRLAVEVLSGILERMGLEGEVVRVSEQERIEIEIAGPDAGRLIGKKGQTLDALQFLVNKVVNRFPEGRQHVVLDVEGYKDRRDETLAAMAHRLAEKASRTGKVITISPMPSRERRVIHMALAECAGVTTRSDGEGTERRVRIIPDRRRERSPR
jgi:spoIIIJ-associated protein